MNIGRCPYCAGTLTFNEKENCYICDYCDTPSFINTVDDEKIQQIKDRANKLFLSCDFDGAASLYQSVVSECTEDAEVYWLLALCTYGIQYVDDPKTGKRIPTCHRTLYSSILNNEDYLNALECADFLSRETYEKAAKIIDEIQRGILEIVARELPYDIFICYKETDDYGHRTKESDIAKDLYYKLTAEGYRAFYAPITLQEKAGQEFEPFIFAALSSAKLMFAIGFSKEHFNAPWVKNEWSRFLARKAKNPRLMLVTCYNSFLMNASDLPEELSKTQAKDLANASTNDLVNSVIKWIPKKNVSEFKAASNVNVNDIIGGNAVALCKRGYLYLEDGQFADAQAYFNKCLDQNPELSKAYWGLLLVKYNSRSNDELITLGKPINGLNEYEKAIRFANGAEQDEYLQVSEQITNKINKTILELKTKRYKMILSTNVQEQIDESQNRILDVQNNVNRLIDELTDIENQIAQYIKECRTSLEPSLNTVSENKQKASALLEKAKQVSSCTNKERATIIETVSGIRKEIDDAYSQALQIKDNSTCFKNLDELIKKQKNTVFALGLEKNKLMDLCETFERTDKKIKEIANNFELAFVQVPNGDYVLAMKLLSEAYALSVNLQDNEEEPFD